MNAFIKVDNKEPELKTIVEAIKTVTNIDIRNTSRKHEITSLKKIYYKIANALTSVPLKYMAEFVMTTNHGTVLFHLKNVDDLLDQNEYYRNVYINVMEIVNGAMNVQVEDEGDRLVYYVEKTNKNKQQISFVDKVIREGKADLYLKKEKDTGLPEHIVNHLLVFTPEELVDLYENRIIPYANMIGKGG